MTIENIVNEVGYLNITFFTEYSNSIRSYPK